MADISQEIAKLGIYDNTFIRLQQAVEKAAKKQAVIAQNIANANNPDYVALEFDEALNKAVKRSNKQIVIEDEMAAMSKNQIEHSAYIKLLASKISVLRTAVTQGRK
jgi:flagellar basal body rod protein FlgB